MQKRIKKLIQIILTPCVIATLINRISFNMVRFREDPLKDETDGISILANIVLRTVKIIAK